jgi:hypothetical protein
MTALISDDNMNKMRATQELNLPEVAYIQKYTSVPDGQGGFLDPVWQTVATTNARIGLPKGEIEKTEAGRIDSGRVFVITLPADTVLDDEDQIQIDGNNYRVHWTNKKRSHLTALRVIVSPATGGTAQSAPGGG